MPTSSLTEDEKNALTVGTEMNAMVTSNEEPMEVRLLNDDDYDDDYDEDELEESSMYNDEDSEGGQLSNGNGDEDSEEGAMMKKDSFKPPRLTKEEQQEVLQSYAHTFDEISKGTNAAAVEEILQWSEIKHLRESGLIDETVLDSLLSEAGAAREGTMTFDKFVHFNELIEMHLGGADMYVEDKDSLGGAYSEQFEELSKDGGQTVAVQDVIDEDVAGLVDRGNLTMSEVHSLLREVKSDPRGQFTYDQYEEFLDGLDRLLDEKHGGASGKKAGDDSGDGEYYEFRDNEEEDRQTFHQLTGDRTGRGLLGVQRYVEWATREEQLFSEENLSMEGLGVLLDLMGVSITGGSLTADQFVKLNHIIDYIEEGPGSAATAAASRLMKQQQSGDGEVDMATRAATQSETMEDVYYRLCRGMPAVKTVDLLQWCHNQGILDTPERLEEHGVELLLDLMKVDPVRGSISYQQFMKLNEAIATILYGDKTDGEDEYEEEEEGVAEGEEEVQQIATKKIEKKEEEEDAYAEQEEDDEV